MFDKIFEFFKDTIFGGNILSGYVIQNMTLFGNPIGFKYYLSIICALITSIFIFILCCLFVYKIIKLIGGLIR